MRLANVLAVLRTSGSAQHSDQVGLRHERVDQPVVNQSASITLQADPRSVAAAREFVKDVLQGWDVVSGRDVVATARLLVSELFTNAVIHNDSSAVQLALAVRGSILRIEVVDNGGSSPDFHETSASDMDEHGRGLLLVRELAERWGKMTERSGTRVWFDLALTS
jgi:serine/threonine-protein kinase RsbW